MNRFGVPLLLGLLLAVAPAHAQVVTGQAVIEGTEVAVPAALVQLLNTEGRIVSQTLTDSEGSFQLTSPEPGQFTVAGSRIGFERTVSTPIDLEADEIERVTLQLPVDPIQLDGLDVEWTRGLERGRYQFARRQEFGTGFFFSREMIREMGVEHPGEIFREVPGLLVDYDYRGHAWVQTTKGWQCLIIFEDHRIDNILQRSQHAANVLQRPSIYGSRNWARMRPRPRPFRSLEDVKIDEIMGLEVYRSFAEVPDEIRESLYLAKLWSDTHLGGCGMAIVWTGFGW
jgi:hypothetical protein